MGRGNPYKGTLTRPGYREGFPVACMSELRSVQTVETFLAWGQSGCVGNEEKHISEEAVSAKALPWSGAQHV